MIITGLSYPQSHVLTITAAELLLSEARPPPCAWSLTTARLLREISRSILDPFVVPSKKDQTLRVESSTCKLHLPVNLVIFGEVKLTTRSFTRHGYISYTMQSGQTAASSAPRSRLRQPMVSLICSWVLHLMSLGVTKLLSH